MLKTLSKDFRIKLLLAGLGILVVGFFVGYQYRQYEIEKNIREAFNSIEDPLNSNETADTAEAEQDIENATVLSSNEEAEYATVKLKFNSAKSSKTLSSTYSSPVVATQGSKFIVVNITATNLTDHPYTLEAFRLLDDSNRSYNTDSDGTFAVDDYIEYREIAPGVPERGSLVYKVPDSSNSFKIGGANAETGELIFIQFTTE